MFSYAIVIRIYDEITIYHTSTDLYNILIFCAVSSEISFFHYSIGAFRKKKLCQSNQLPAIRSLPPSSLYLTAFTYLNIYQIVNADMAIQLNRMDVAGLDWRADYVSPATWYTQRKVYRDEHTIHGAE